MKKSIIAICIALIATMNYSIGQLAKTTSTTKTTRQGDTASNTNFSTTLAPLNGYLNEMNTRATRDFLKRFDNPTNVLWSKNEKGWLVSCSQNGIKSRTLYNTKGDWMNTIKYYDQWKMPRELRAMIRSTYYDFNITQVDEIWQSGKNEPYYQVHLEDETSWKNVMIHNGEMEVVEEWDKG